MIFAVFCIRMRSGTVNHVAVRNELPGDTLSGIQSGQGIFVETAGGSATLTVENCSVHNYQKNGIVARYNANLIGDRELRSGKRPDRQNRSEWYRGFQSHGND